ncbi:uncharacterized protein LOC131599176 [Vicia villosa]|uniref:uncharacterized protein LOC131599176 n=1 Tax=Vicia villosa TaxID=3911 RepID=UPI00273CA4AF|nr:uncharacterized protein LOC131599176 [Vicia villosa]
MTQVEELNLKKNIITAKEFNAMDVKEESAKHVTAFTGVCNSDEDSSDDELTFEELAASYRKLCIRSAEVCQQSEKQKKYIAQLEADNKGFSKTISELNNEIIMLQSKLDQMSKSVKMLNSGSDMLDEILQIGKSSGDMSGIGFVGTKKPSQDGNRIKPETEMLNPMSRHATQHQDRSIMKRKFQRWRCHHCGRFGHIKPFCFRHMTGIKNLLVDIRSHATSYVTFGDGAKGEIKGVGKLNCSGVPNLEGVLLVKGLTANLISISQLCDQGYQVNFTRAECVVTDEGKNVIMRGVRDHRRKMDSKSDEGIFLGYSTNSRAYRVFNSRTRVIMESINVVVDDEHKQADVTYDVGTFWEQAAEDSRKEDECRPSAAKSEAELSNKGPSIRIQKDHPSELIIGDPNSGVVTRSREQVSNSCFVSKTEPKNVKEALTDEFWINAMQEELCQFERNEVWELVPRPQNSNVIGTKWT